LRGDATITTLTVTEAAIIDLQKGKEAMARRAQNFGLKAAGRLPPSA